MRLLCSLLMVVLPCSVFAGTDCRIVEYEDHSEVMCVGAADRAPASSQRTPQDQFDILNQTVTATNTPESEQTDVPPEKMVLNDLTRLYASAWLKRLPGH